MDLITADWSDQGVPLSAVGVEPVLVFISATDPDGNQLTAANADGVTLANAPGAAVTAALDCSFAGGCQYSISGLGWNASLKNSDNSVMMCEVACVYDEVNSM